MSKKKTPFVRIMCWILAGLMAASAATTVIAFIIAGIQ
jgi:hypothetical protein